MAANKPETILYILKILTPSTLMGMTKSIKRNDRVALTQMLQVDFGFIKEEKKPLAKEEIKEEIKEEVKQEEKQKEKEEEEKEEKKEEAPQEEGATKEQSFSIFLLEEKRKMLKAQKDLKKKEILQLYLMANQTGLLPQESEDEIIDEDERPTGSKGSIVNKRQY